MVSLLAVAPCRALFIIGKFLNSQVSFCHGRQNSEPPRTAVVQTELSLKTTTAYSEFSNS
ncbi:hypothetical protein DWQ65_08725 [Treponema phagedenis]|nr:hypothetical protein DWQ65_08725 [Treponema phagedenis]